MCVPTAGPALEKHQVMRNGVTTASQPFTSPTSLTENQAKANQRRNVVKQDRGLQEGWEWYDKCYVRERNQGGLKSGSLEVELGLRVNLSL